MVTFFVSRGQKEVPAQGGDAVDGDFGTVRVRRIDIELPIGKLESKFVHAARAEKVGLAKYRGIVLNLPAGAAGWSSKTAKRATDGIDVREGNRPNTWLNSEME